MYSHTFSILTSLCIAADSVSNEKNTVGRYESSMTADCCPVYQQIGLYPVKLVSNRGITRTLDYANVERARLSLGVRNFEFQPSTRCEYLNSERLTRNKFLAGNRRELYCCQHSVFLGTRV
jgi:hypothetical protein